MTAPFSRLWNPWKEDVDGPGTVHSFLLLSLVPAGASAAPPLLPAAEFLHDEEDPEVYTVVATRNGQVSTGPGSCKPGQFRGWACSDVGMVGAAEKVAFIHLT